MSNSDMIPNWTINVEESSSYVYRVTATGPNGITIEKYCTEVELNKTLEEIKVEAANIER